MKPGFSNIVLDSNSDLPLYKQVSSVIAANISKGLLKPKDRIPSENEMMEVFGVSRITVRAAIAELVESGKLVKHQGKGTFVAGSESNLYLSDSMGFTEMCRIQGKTPSTRILSREFVNTPKSLLEYFQKDYKLLKITRLRYVDGIPLEVEHNYCSEELFGLSQIPADKLEGSLYQYLRTSCGIERFQGNRITEASLPSEEEQKLLQIKRNTPLLHILDVHFTDGEKLPAFCSDQIYNTEYIKFISSFIANING